MQSNIASVNLFWHKVSPPNFASRILLRAKSICAPECGAVRNLFGKPKRTHTHTHAENPTQILSQVQRARSLLDAALYYIIMLAEVFGIRAEFTFEPEDLAANANRRRREGGRRRRRNKDER